MDYNMEINNNIIKDINGNNVTNEQYEYIIHNIQEDTRLIACAGSGKTRCIALKMNELIKNKIYKTENIMMLTFSKNTKDDFLHKIEKYKTTYLTEESIKTIDSYSKSLIENGNEIDVSLLSLKFMQYLENNNEETLRKNKKLNQIKILFIDEAQDLNDIQFRICIQLKNKLGVLLNLIGDPNQNIYQFRGSSDKYFMSLNTYKTFYLTKNFRSEQGILDFSNYLRPIGDTKIQCMQGPSKHLPVFFFHRNELEFEKELIGIFKGTNGKVDYSDFAILSPTRGKMRGHGKSNGLCFVTNILYKAGIKFKQFYEEATDDTGTKIDYKPEKGYVNILTYMGSKGLEWKYVILIDANNCLINKRYFDEEKHNNDRYLLYVGCSRAIKNMFIFSSCHNDIHGIVKFNLNKWFSKIPKNYYKIMDTYLEYFNFSLIKYTEHKKDTEQRITKIIDKMSEYQLDDLANLIKYGINKNMKTIKKIFPEEYIQNDNTENSIFLGKFTESLFNCYSNIRHNRSHKKYIDIENIIHSKNMLSNVPPYVIDWFLINRNRLTWDLYDKEKDKLDNKITSYIESNFNRECNFSEHTMLTDGSYKWHILDVKDWIKTVYEKYTSCKLLSKMRSRLFDVMVIVHSLETQHYFHIRDKGRKFISLIDKHNNMFKHIKSFAINTEIDFSENWKTVTGYEMMGEIDIIDSENRLWEIKCVTDISLRHILQLLMYNIIYNNINETLKKGTKKIRLNYLNFLKGEIVYIDIKLTKTIVNKIVNQFTKTAGLSLD